MAMSGDEVPGKKGTSLSESQLCASEENFHLFCHACADDNKHVPAHGFCMDCLEYLCPECVQFHRRVRATKNHVIQDKDSMPRDAKQLQNISQSKDPCTEPCPKHPEKLLEYYCKAHDELECSVCVTLGHLTCGVGYIPGLAKGITDTEEYKQISQKISSLHKQSVGTSTKSKESIKEVENQSQAFTDEVTQLGEEIINHVRELVEKVVKEKDEFVKEMLAGLEVSQEQNNEVIEELNSMSSSMEAKTNSDNQSFILMRKIKLKIKETENTLRKVQICSKPTVFQFSKNPKMTAVKSIASMGTLEKYKKVATQCEDIDISTNKDKETPWITGLEILSDGRLALADGDNSSIKLVATKDKTVSEIKLPGKPWDLTEVSKGQLAVTLPLAGKIQLMSVENSMCFGHVIGTGAYYQGISAYQGKLIVGVIGYFPHIQILSITGQLLRKIITGENGKNLFLFPRYIAVNSNNNSVYVSDCGAQTVTCMTLEGEVKAVYSCDKSEKPCGMATDNDGSVFVCGSDSIHHITADGTKKQSVLEHGQVGYSSHQSVAYDTNTGKLYLSSFRKLLHVYQLK